MGAYLFCGRLRRGIVALAIVGLVALAGCGGSSGSNGSGGGPTAKGGGGATITIQNFAFHGDLTVAPSAKVTVRNQDTVAHTLTAKDGSFDTGSIAAGGSASFTAPSKPGKYPIGCTFHPNMAGTLVVGAAQPSSTSGNSGSNGNGY
jgi:plastocyanin